MSYFTSANYIGRCNGVTRDGVRCSATVGLVSGNDECFYCPYHLHFDTGVPPVRPPEVYDVGDGFVVPDDASLEYVSSDSDCDTEEDYSESDSDCETSYISSDSDCETEEDESDTEESDSDCETEKDYSESESEESIPESECTLW
uniref:Uncharacterized protein n=1 Tax=Pithovirus LCPAC304 TaxID=2506594 RepID=A0A481Z7Y8_9VIRU|nr:MAG: hypothetical protein LCPAC304_03560 [Pithovirus LCPAC304]